MGDKSQRHTLTPKPDLNMQGRLRVPRTKGARLPLRAHLYICMFLHRGRIRSFLEGKNVTYIGLIAIPGELWGAGGLPPVQFLMKKTV